MDQTATIREIEHAEGTGHRETTVASRLAPSPLVEKDDVRRQAHPKTDGLALTSIQVLEFGIDF